MTELNLQRDVIDPLNASSGVLQETASLLAETFTVAGEAFPSGSLELGQSTSLAELVTGQAGLLSRAAQGFSDADK